MKKILLIIFLFILTQILFPQSGKTGDIIPDSMSRKALIGPEKINPNTYMNPPPKTRTDKSKNYSISGKVTDAIDSNALGGANIIIDDTLGTASDVNGRYIIRNIHKGKHIIRISYVDYPTKTDTVVFSSENKSIKKDYKIGYMVIEPEQISEIKEYYNNLKLSAGYKNLIEIFMDTLVTGKDSLGVFATVVNNTNYPVYIASPKDAFPLFFEIKQSDGENISGFGDIVIERDALAKEITILLPKGKIKYTLWRSPIPYEIKLSSDSIFTIRIIYENELEYIRIPYDDKLSMEDCLTHVSDYESILQWKLPGEYFSKNSMIFKHTPDKK